MELRDYPILGTDSVRASRLALAAGLQGNYADAHFALMAREDDLLDVVTERYKSRLVDRGPDPEELRRHVERLAESPLASSRPLALAQTCAQYGQREGACAPHSGYVRRAMVLEEMLALGRLTLSDLETELAGGPRPSLREGVSGRNRSRMAN